MVGLAYYRFAMTNPQRYELIMGTASTPQPLLDIRTDVTVTGRPTDRADRSASYDVLHGVVQRMIAAGRIRDDGCLAMTARLWTICHGAVSLELAGYFGHEGHGLTEVLGPLAVDAIVGMGDEREKTMRSLATAMELTGAEAGRRPSIRSDPGDPRVDRPPVPAEGQCSPGRHRSSGRRPPRRRRSVRRRRRVVACARPR